VVLLPLMSQLFVETIVVALKRDMSSDSTLAVELDWGGWQLGWSQSCR
jgi:hypothetical protein